MDESLWTIQIIVILIVVLVLEAVVHPVQVTPHLVHFAVQPLDLAVEFAARFYKCLLKQNMPIAKALWQVKADYQAEQVALPASQRDPSWLFYCLYGDPLTTFTV